MSQETIDKILQKRQLEDSQEVSPEENPFFSSLTGEGIQENFLEIRFRDGLRTCFSYSDLVWFNFDPDGGILDLEFGGFLISIKGRGLGGKLFHQLKSKRVAWIREADSDFQDHDENELFIEEVTITPPDGFHEEEGGQG